MGCEFAHKGKDLETIPLTIPLLLLSTQMKDSGEMEKHFLTPFGYLDILFPLRALQEQESRAVDITVVGDIDTWMLDESMPGEFLATLHQFLQKIIQRHGQFQSNEDRQLSIHFRTGRISQSAKTTVAGMSGTSDGEGDVAGGP